MKAKGKKKLDQKAMIRIGALALAALMVLGVVFSTIGTQSTHSHDHYTAEELAALQAVLDATGEDHTDHDHTLEELEAMLDEAAETGDAEGETVETEEDHTGHDHD